jgi:hypothetical protein
MPTDASRGRGCCCDITSWRTVNSLVSETRRTLSDKRRNRHCHSPARGGRLTAALVQAQQQVGMTVVQDPKDAEFAEMPLTALNRAKPDHVVGLADMPALLGSLAHKPAGEARLVPRSIKYEVEIARGGSGNMNDMDGIGRRSVLACPDCGGVMWEIDEDELDIGARTTLFLFA